MRRCAPHALALTRLRASGCEFNRSDASHPAAQAKAHVVRKLGAVEERTTIDTTERFIDLSRGPGGPYCALFLADHGADGLLP